jgi:hypothetical protein
LARSGRDCGLRESLPISFSRAEARSSSWRINHVLRSALACCCNDRDVERQLGVVTSAVSMTAGSGPWWEAADLSVSSLQITSVTAAAAQLPLCRRAITSAAGVGVELVEKCFQSRGEYVVVIPGDHMTCRLYVNGLGVGDELQHVCDPAVADDV